MIMYYILIGVCRDQDAFMSGHRNTWPKDRIGFIYEAKGGVMREPNNTNYPRAKFVKVGDVLKIKLDLKKMECRLTINGVDHGIIPGISLQKQIIVCGCPFMKNRLKCNYYLKCN